MWHSWALFPFAMTSCRHLPPMHHAACKLPLPPQINTAETNSLSSTRKKKSEKHPSTPNFLQLLPQALVPAQVVVKAAGQGLGCGARLRWPLASCCFLAKSREGKRLKNAKVSAITSRHEYQSYSHFYKCAHIGGFRKVKHETKWDRQAQTGKNLA